VATLTLAAAGVLNAQVKKGKSRPMKTAQWMKGVMKPNCDALKKGLDAGPADDKTWEELGVHAAVINEGSYLLMDDGRCPDGTWADAASKTLRQGSADVLAAIVAKDLSAAKASFGNMTKSCKACHDAHKEKK
jgi:hypothetical protein